MTIQYYALYNVSSITRCAKGVSTLYEKKATLRYVNRIRAACGVTELDSLPSGTQRSSSDCVIARALCEASQGVLVFQEGIYSDDLAFAKIIAEEFGYLHDCIGLDSSDDIKKYVVPIPKIMSAFVENFDEGLYPELVTSDR